MILGEFGEMMSFARKDLMQTRFSYMLQRCVRKDVNLMMMSHFWASGKAISYIIFSNHIFKGYIVLTMLTQQQPLVLFPQLSWIHVGSRGERVNVPGCQYIHVLKDSSPGNQIFFWNFTMIFR